MLDPQKKKKIRESISFGNKNVSQIARATRLSRPTIYNYLKELKKEEGYSTKRSGKNTIVESNTDKNLDQALSIIQSEISGISTSIKEIIRAYRKPHPRSKKVDLMHIKYRYRLASFNNIVARLLELQRVIFYLKSISGLRKQRTQELNDISNDCLELITKIQENVIKISPERKKEIIDFFASNIMGSIYPQK